jgi:class 3 adenylate cyclase/predicted ATPase
MTFDDVLAQVLEILQRQGRISYGALRRRFALDEAYLNDLKTELIDAQRLAVDEEGRILVWVGPAGETPAPPALWPAPPPAPPGAPSSPGHSPPVALAPPEAERRQLTVMVCDLVDSTPLAGQLDPEDLLTVIHAYQTTCTGVIQRFAGEIAQHLGDGLLVYFGYPQAHDDDAQRAVRAGLGILEAMETLNHRLGEEHGVRLALRVGIHTGLVVVGAMGGAGRPEQLALGETPHLAARLQTLARPDTVVMSETTARLVAGYFTCQPLGRQALTTEGQPIAVHHVLGESGASSRVDVVPPRGLTPLVGRESEVSLMLERWAQAKAGLGQVVLVSGEAGIGKSRLVQVLKDHLADAPHKRWECRGSPYYQHTAFYPLIDLWERALHFQREETVEAKLAKLERALAPSHLPLDDTVPLLAALLALPVPAARYRPLAGTPQRQKQQTLQALLALVLERADEQPVLFIVEDLHWVDPSTLEFLTLLIDQGPTAAVLTVLTCRPEFQPPWGLRTHLTPLAVHRLPPTQASVLVERVTGGKPLPPEVTQQVVTKTDGVPLFVEELTKMVVESGLLREHETHYELTGPLPPLAIPITLHDSLMARLDRLAPVKVVAQLGATLGRTFAYALLQAVALVPEATLQDGLQQLVEAEILYQRGVPPQATYQFKHALLQDAAYQALLRSTRQQYHQRIAQTFEAQFPEMAETQPEVLAQHYTAAGVVRQALHYWHQAGQRAHARAAHAEAVAHLTQGLALLTTLPAGPERLQHELTLHLALGPPLMVTKGFAAPEVGATYDRARILCQQVEETPDLFRVIRGLFGFYEVRAEFGTAHDLAAQLLHLAQRFQQPALFIEAHRALGDDLYYLGEFGVARQHLEQGLALYTAEHHHHHAILYGQDPGVGCLNYLALLLWLLGYPTQAGERNRQAQALAQARGHPFTLSLTRYFTARFHYYRRERPAVEEQAQGTLALSREQGFALFAAGGTILHGWSRAVQRPAEEAIADMHRGLDAWRATGAKMAETFFLALFAEAYSATGHVAAGLDALTEALALVPRTGEQYHTAELYRLQGTLLLQTSHQEQSAAEACFQHALDAARRQEAKSLELRAAMSLSRLWQQQGKRTAAYDLLAPVYGWFTEGFDTADLQDAKALLEELRGSPGAAPSAS